MDALKKVIRGQGTTLDNGEQIQLVEKSRVEGWVRIVNAKGKLDTISIKRIAMLDLAVSVDKKPKTPPMFKQDDLIAPQKERGW